ncbi:MAG: hypothetical protein GY943_34470 [Chloroflexi bacterium]|nr:hypothetical protein [Chloroflexota bacterium]
MEKSTESQLADYFSVFREKQTYLNLLYLFLAFPLGIAYFVLSVTGLSLGVGLLIVWVGLFILLALFAAWWGIAAFERQLAIHLLGEEIAPMSFPAAKDDTAWERVKEHFRNPVTWKSMLYLLLKFPLGIASFVAGVTAVSIPGALIFAPFLYKVDNLNIGSWHINTFGEAFLATIVGLLIAPFAMRLLNLLARLSGQFARFMLGNESISKEKSPEDILKVA